jgi:hypothetical protein
VKRLDQYLLVAVTLSILINVGINFTTSYTHIYMLSLYLGDGGVNARLTPVGIDTMLLSLGLANVFAARLRRSSKWLRLGLGFGVFGTVLANAAYGAWHGYSGTMLAIWSPIALFITVESGLYMFRIAADFIASPKPQARRPRQPRPARPSKDIAVPVIRGRVDPFYPFGERDQAA